MNLFAFYIGKVVRSKFDNSIYGHVVGFTRNNSGETILLVRWNYSNENSSIHPENVETK